MKPQDLNLEQLKAIPLDEYDSLGYHKASGSAMCYNHGGFKECLEAESGCPACILNTPKSVKARIKELKNKKP
jgi:PHP family Zn ribbon phosphoesterase